MGVAAGVVAALVLPVGAVVWRAEGLGALAPGDRGALWFTLWQAAVSATLSLLLAVPVARALARRAFPGRGTVVLLLGAPFILPVIVAVLGLVAVFGRSGWLAALGVEWPLYGWGGVILAHVFFNLPLATRLLLQAWLSVPPERLRLAASLGFGPGDVMRVIERPLLRAVGPGIWLAVFLICTTSFAVALTLGGGPRSTTVELAIYQAFRFDFDLGRAASLALLQLALGVGAALLALRLAVPSGFGAGLGGVAERWDHRTPLLRAQDAVAVAAACLFLLAPMGAVLWRGVPALPDLPASVWAAAGRSLAVALLCAVLTAGAALALALAALRTGWIEAVGTAVITASPLVLGAGLFLLLRPWANPVALALPVTLLVNVLLSLPFALRALMPAVRDLDRDFGRLAASLGMTGLAWLRLVGLPRLRRPLGYAAGLAGALAAGDLGVIALFASPGQATLPLAMYQLMGSYRMEEAMAAALLLVALSLGLFAAFERGSRAA
ncbi:thiamine/thiamine pyrophosphate ABC transporter permease ThiP [Jannaschia sp. Os4]|nr:thiamine/thiamine pyrophosphate ABC transporter permease ThiP [Jannaschia sp. Os4]